MTIAAVQRFAKGNQGASTSITIGSGDGWVAPTSGNLLVVSGNGDFTMTTPTGSGTWSAGPSVVDGNGAYVWYKTANGTETAVTAQLTSGTFMFNATLCEYSGVGAFDVSNSGTISSTNGLVSPGASVTTTVGGGLILSFALNHSATLPSASASWSAGLTQVLDARSTTGTWGDPSTQTFAGELLGAGTAGTISPVCTWTVQQAADRQQITLAFKPSAGGGSVVTGSPLVVAAPPTAVRPSIPALLRNTAALIVAPAKGTAALVTTRPVPVPPAAALLRRSTLLDPPVLTTARPIVVTAAVAAAASSSILLRAPQVGAALAVATTPGPIVVTALVLSPIAPTILVRAPQALAASPQPTVVTAPAAPPIAEVLLVRGSLSDAPVLTTASPTVVTTPAPPAAPAAIQLRNPQPSAAIVSGPTTAPIVITQPGPPPASTATTLRSSLVDVPVATPGPMVVTGPAPVRPSPPIVARGSLADYYAGTEPLVVTAAVPGLRGTALLGRNPQPFIPPIPGPTTRPIVVTAVRPAPPGLVVQIRGVGVAGCDCMTHRPNLGTTARPSSGVTVRPGSATTVRPSAGATSRPAVGVTSRPCTCQGE